MRFLKTYGRVLGLLGRDIRIAGFLAFANLMVAGLQFLDPVLFGRVVNLLSQSDHLPQSQMWHEAAILLGIWVCVGIGGILSNIAVALQTERLAHRHRIKSHGAVFPACAGAATVVSWRDAFRAPDQGDADRDRWAVRRPGWCFSATNCPPFCPPSCCCR